MAGTDTTAALSPAAWALRIAHAAIAASFLLAIGYVWWCALSGRRGPLLHVAIASLITEGVLVGANGGDCPLGGLQDRVDDPVPLFELVLSPKAARRAVPVLGLVAGAGIAVVWMPISPRLRRGLSCQGAVPGGRAGQRSRPAPPPAQ